MFQTFLIIEVQRRDTERRTLAEMTKADRKVEVDFALAALKELEGGMSFLNKAIKK